MPTMRTITTILLGLLASTAYTLPAEAQTGDSIVMRKVMPELEAPNFPGKWTAGDWTWAANAPSCSDAAVQTRAYYCMQNGAVVPEGRCKGPAPKPEQKSTARYEACTYSWTKTGTGNWNKTCSDAASRTLSYECRRMGGDSAAVAVAGTMCGASPSLTETGPNYEGCTYAWKPTSYGSWAESCSSSTTRTVSYVCRRSGGDALPFDAPSDKCGTAPSDKETAANYAGCTYAWARRSNGEWSGDKCVASSTRTVDWGCQRSGGTYQTSFVPAGEESFCTTAKPTATESGGGCLLSNGGFESNVVGAETFPQAGKWSAWGEGQAFITTVGDRAGKVFYIRSGMQQYNRHDMGQAVRMLQGVSYKVTFSYRATGVMRLQLANDGFNYPAASQWTTVTRTWTSPSTYNAGYLIFTMRNYDSAYIDDVSIEAQ